jgi:hypothetical protein
MQELMDSYERMTAILGEAATKAIEYSGRALLAVGKA